MSRRKIVKNFSSINLNLSFLSVIFIIFFILVASIYSFQTNKKQVEEKTTKEEVTKTEDINSETLKTVEQFLSKNNLNKDIEIIKDKQGARLEIRDSLLFEPSKADLTYDSKELLDKITILISKLDNNIIVEGYTDNIPVNTYKYESNWELSSVRAVSIVRYFTEVKKLDKKRFSAVGFGDSRPIVDNNTNENRARNRRINILILAK